MVTLEDCYLPYRPKRRTRASIAKEAGLEPLADSLLQQQGPLPALADFHNSDHQITDDEAALAGARDIIAETVQLVRERVGPVAVFKQAVVVDRLPKTRSGKILRSTMRSIADAEEYRTPATIEDPVVLEEIKTALHSIGYAG